MRLCPAVLVVALVGCAQPEFQHRSYDQTFRVADDDTEFFERMWQPDAFVDGAIGVVSAPYDFYVDRESLWVVEHDTRQVITSDAASDVPSDLRKRLSSS